MKKWDYLHTMLKEGRMYRFKAARVSKIDAHDAFIKSYTSISKKFDEIASNREDFKKGLIIDNYLFLFRYKELVILQLKRHNMQKEIFDLEAKLHQYEGLINSFKY